MSSSSSNLEAPPLMRKFLIGQLFHNTTNQLPIYNAIRQVWEMNIVDNNNNNDDKTNKSKKLLSWCMLWLQGRITNIYQSTNNNNNNTHNFILDDGTGKLLIIYELDKNQPVNYQVTVGDYVAVVGKLIQPKHNNNDNDKDDNHHHHNTNELLNGWHILAKSVTHLNDQTKSISSSTSSSTSSSSPLSSRKTMSNSAFY
ncbi:unnamed protein product [Schistosoma turkestanicum]|nr:unnamed protein product [Schistosoma turkestanicum]